MQLRRHLPPALLNVLAGIRRPDLYDRLNPATRVRGAVSCWGALAKGDGATVRREKTREDEAKVGGSVDRLLPWQPLSTPAASNARRAGRWRRSLTRRPARLSRWATSICQEPSQQLQCYLPSSSGARARPTGHRAAGPYQHVWVSKMYKMV